MKVRNILFIAITSACAVRVQAQSSFVNSDFESAIQPLIADAFGFVPASNAIPGWTAYVGGNPVDAIYYDGETISSAGISLISSASYQNYPLIEGNYSLLLQSATQNNPPSLPTYVAIGQMVIIPFDSRSLLFAESSPNWGGIPIVTFAGQPIPISAVGSYGGATLYGGDVSSFAGQPGELLFTVTPTISGTRQEALLDAISFSPTSVVPEPSALALFGLGLVGLGWHWRRDFRA